MSDFSRGMAIFGQSLEDAMNQYHQEHKKYDEALGFADALSRVGIDKRTGAPVQIQYDEKGKIINGENIQTFADPKALDQYRNFNRREAAKNMGALDAYTRLGVSFMARAQAAAIEDASVSGLRARQIYEQQQQAGPIEQKQREATLEETQLRVKRAKEYGDKEWVPGYGWMTAKDKSMHEARQAKLKAAEEKLKPMNQFQNEVLQAKYGLTIPDVLAATTGTFQTGIPGKPKEQTQLGVGVQYVDAAGQPVSAEQYTKDVGTGKYKTKHPSIFAVVGPNKTRVPVDKWEEIVGISKNFAVQNIDPLAEQKRLRRENDVIQATNIMNRLAPIDPKMWTDEDKTAYEWAQGALVQQQ